MKSASKSSSMVSIIIPHWNGKEILKECLDSLRETCPPNCEIIVVDNASTDGSADWVREHYPEVILVENSINRGYAGGCNSGAEHAQGNYLLFLNNDTIHRQGWIEHLVDAMDGDPELAAVQPKILNYYHRDSFDYAGGSGGEIDIFIYPFARGRVFQNGEKDHGQYDESAEIFWASGTAFMVRTDLFHVVGGFDEAFFAHMEEIDLCWRFHLMGKRVCSVPSAVIYHRNAVTLAMYSFQKYYLNHRNSMMLLLSNYSFPLMVYLFPLRLALEFVALGYALVLRDWNHAKGIIRSLGWLMVHPRLIFRRRRMIKSLRRIRDREVLQHMYRGSIVWAYYILGKKTYGALDFNRPR